MKKAFLIAALFVATASLSKAQQNQPQRSPEERVKMQTERLNERLKLTADQKTKIEAILLSQAKSMDSLRNAAGEGADRRALFGKMGPIREQNDKKIAALLTEEQKKTYTTMQEEMRSRMGQGRRDGGQRPPQPAN